MRGSESPVLFAQLNREQIRAAVACLANKEDRSIASTVSTPAEHSFKSAAVAAVLCPNVDGEACFVLTRRSSELRSHAGQWALPGGRLDPGETASDAALRELKEEVGVSVECEHVLGALDSYFTRSGYSIVPIVCWHPLVPQFAPNSDEVESVHLVPLAALDSPDVPVIRSIPESDRPVLSLPLLGQRIHAPTAAMVYQLFELVFRNNKVRVAHYEQPVFAWQ